MENPGIGVCGQHQEWVMSTYLALLILVARGPLPSEYNTLRQSTFSKKSPHQHVSVSPLYLFTSRKIGYLYVIETIVY